MIKIDYYNFSVLSPYKCNGESHRTLREAKEAYLKHIAKGHRVGCDIHGCSLKDSSIFLTFTPWYSDSMEFGRTQKTYYAIAMEKGVYHIS